MSDLVKESKELLEILRNAPKPSPVKSRLSYDDSWSDDWDDEDDEKPASKPADAPKRGRGRPKGSSSGARQVGSTAAKKKSFADYTGYKLHLPNTNK